MIRLRENSAFDFLSDDYRDLFRRADASAFQHPVWLQGIHDRLVPASGHRPATLEGRSAADGRLLLVCPLVRRRIGPFSVLDAADLGVSDYNGIVIDRDFAAAAARDGALRAEISAALRRSVLVRVRKVREDDLGGVALLGRNRLSPMGFRAHEVPLGPSFAAWRSGSFRPDFARFLDKKGKRLGNKGEVRFEEVTDPDAIGAAFERMRSFRASRWPNDILNGAAHRAFYLDVARAGVADGLARTYRLTVAGTPRAVLFGLSQGPRFLFLLLGFDMAELRNYSLGLLTLERAMEDCILRGQTVFDLTIGDESYKSDFPSRSVPMLTAWIAHPATSILAHAAFAQFQKLRALRARWRSGREAGLGS